MPTTIIANFQKLSPKSWEIWTYQKGSHVCWELLKDANLLAHINPEAPRHSRPLPFSSATTVQQARTLPSSDIGGRNITFPELLEHPLPYWTYSDCALRTIFTPHLFCVCEVLWLAWKSREVLPKHMIFFAALVWRKFGSLIKNLLLIWEFLLFHGNKFRLIPSRALGNKQEK